MLPVSVPGFADPFSSISHLAFAVWGLLSGIRMMWNGRGHWLRVTALGLYVFGVVFLFSMSGVFHLLDRGILAREVFQRLDHAAIWVLIAGTFTPLHVIAMRGWWRWGVLFFVWTTSITGLVLKTVFFHEIPEWASVSLYLALGWVGVLSMYHMWRQFGFKEIKLGLLAGALYSVGALIDFFHSFDPIFGIIGPHEVFHVFVCAAAYSHWVVIKRWSNRLVDRNLVFLVTHRENEDYTATALSDRLEVHAHDPVELKARVLAAIAARSHPNLTPEHVHFRYMKEDVFKNSAFDSLKH